MNKYVIYESNCFDVIESKGRFVIKPTEEDINILNDIKLEYFGTSINSFINKEFPLSWINEIYIEDEEFVNKYYPEFLI